MQTVVTELDLTYRRRFSDIKIPEAYESLILDALKGDHSNFVRNDELDASWRIFTPLLHYLDTNEEITPMEYPYGKFFFHSLQVADPLANLSRLTCTQAHGVPRCSTISPHLTATNLCKNLYKKDIDIGMDAELDWARYAVMYLRWDEQSTPNLQEFKMTNRDHVPVLAAWHQASSPTS